MFSTFTPTDRFAVDAARRDLKARFGLRLANAVNRAQQIESFPRSYSDEAVTAASVLMRAILDAGRLLDVTRAAGVFHDLLEELDAGRRLYRTHRR